MSKQKFVKWQGKECRILFGEYANGRIAIMLENIKPRQRSLVATVNIPDEPLQENEVIIKDYSENQGILEVLQYANIIGPVKRGISTGYVSVQVVDLLIKPE